ncbi:MAG: peptidoglycan editing factor PgeF [Clostridiales bacterium]|nr:peptidoglycan editing factor PgeF [Clostridiales bacterium]
MKFLSFPLHPEVQALLTTRLGGLSRGPFRWANMGRVDGEPEAVTRANWALFLGSLSLPEEKVGRVHQVHGNEVRVIRGDEDLQLPRPKADALLTAHRGVALAILVADCAPIYLVDPLSGTLALVHAGWRGTAGGILPRTLRAMEEAGARMANIHAFIGPHIRSCCYEVGEAVVEAVAKGAGLDPEGVAVRRNGRFYLELSRAQKAQLLAGGVPEDRIGISRLCTGCRTDFFYSHRVEGGRTGRMVALLRWNEEVGIGRRNP